MDENDFLDNTPEKSARDYTGDFIGGDGRTSPSSPSRKQKRVLTALVSVAVIAVLAVTCALIVREYVFTSFIVDGSSMVPTLDGGSEAADDGDTLLLNRIADPDRGDIVVFFYDWGGVSPHYLVKRVIGVAGDRIEIRDGTLYLNGEACDESYIAEPMNHLYDGLSVTVPDGHFFVMGDNRNNSSDSREIGCVPADKVVGKCFLIVRRDGSLDIP